MDIKELYTKKGELVTAIEVAQARLQELNKQIVEELNKTSIASEKAIAS